MSPDPVVYVVDDDPGVLSGIRTLLESSGIRVQTFASAIEFLAAFKQEKPGCLVLDVRLPGMSGLELHETLVQKDACLPVIFLTGHGDAPMAVRAIQRGAFDFIEKPFRQQTLLDRVQQAQRQAVAIWKERGERAESKARVESLTTRQREVIAGFVEGETAERIAERLRLSVKTVYAHRAQAMDRLHADNVTELVRYRAALNADWGNRGKMSFRAETPAQPVSTPPESDPIASTTNEP